MSQEIQYITRKYLNVSKYDACISNAINSRIYAYSWYLDSVADDWDALVLGDYDVVMPLPKRRKYFIQYIYQPAWTQQLGVFYGEFKDKNKIKDFIASIPRKFKKVSVNLNDQNTYANKISTPRDNYVLSLNTDYKDLHSRYSKNRKQSLRKVNKDNIEIVESKKHHNIFPFYYDYIFEKSGLRKIDMQNLDLLLEYGYKTDKAVVIEAVGANNNSLGGAIFLKDKNRFYYLFSALSEEGKKEQAMSLIIDYVIKKYANKPMFLDFEGSMIKGIASFFKSFGAKNVPYYVYEKPLSLF